MQRILKYTQRNYYFLVLGAILAASFVVRAINLNYNSPFNDEAIYVVLGKLGIFQCDWWTYNAASWMAGAPYMYPPLTAIAYVTHGIVGSRFLNVVFGVVLVEVVFVLTFLLAKGQRSQRLIAGLIAAAVAGATPVAIYVSRLATYDMLSFLLLGLSLVCLLLAQRPHANCGKLYAVSAVFLVLAFLTKIIIGAYIPFILLYSYFLARKMGRTHLRFWLIYFCSPLVVLLAIYAIGNASNFLTYAHSQVRRDYSSYSKIIATVLENSQSIWLLWAVGAVGLLIKKQWRLLLVLTTASALILAVHLATHRWPTLDKHVMLSVLFAFPVIGIGLANLIYAFDNRLLRAVTIGIIAVLMPLFWVYSYHGAQSYNSMWINSYEMLGYLKAHSTPDTKVLAEVGAAAILVNYDKDFPSNTATFDWFEYQNKKGAVAYRAALQDGYFDLIELDGEDLNAEDIHNKTRRQDLGLSEVGAASLIQTFDSFEYQNKKGKEAYRAALEDGYFDIIELDRGNLSATDAHIIMRDLIRKNLGDNYAVDYQSDTSTVYKRLF